MDENDLPKRTQPRRWELTRQPQPLPRSDDQLHSAIIAYSKKLNRLAAYIEGPLHHQKQPKLNGRFNARSEERLHLQQDDLSDLAEVLELAAWQLSRNSNGLMNAFATGLAAPGEPYSVRLLQALQSEIDGALAKRRSQALGTLEAFAVPKHGASHPSSPTPIQRLLRLEVHSALVWLSLVEKKATAKDHLRRLLKACGVDKAGPRSMDKWLQTEAQHFYSDPDTPSQFRRHRHSDLSTIPEPERFTAAFAGECGRCSAVYVRNAKFLISLPPYAVSKDLRKFCPGYEETRFDAITEAFDRWYETKERQGWLPWYDKRVSDAQSLYAFKEIVRRVICPLAKLSAKPPQKET